MQRNEYDLHASLKAKAEAHAAKQQAESTQEADCY